MVMCVCKLPKCCPGIIVIVIIIIMTSTKILATRPNASIEWHFGTGIVKTQTQAC